MKWKDKINKQMILLQFLEIKVMVVEFTEW